MRTQYIEILICTDCGGKIERGGQAGEKSSTEMLEGELHCAACRKTFPVARGIARFVESAHYSATFGYEWQKHAFTQYDSHSGHGISQKRLFKETGWPASMKGERILEAGCGSGRFTEHLLSTGATIISVDASVAVGENFTRHKEKENSCIVQADITALPFEQKSFDRVLCIGVLQHTPDPFLTLKALVSMVKSGGSIVVDVYDKQPLYKRIFNTRYWVRPITKRLPPGILHKLVTAYVNLMWPLAKLIHRLPYGVKINHKMLIAEHLSYEKLSPEMQKEWAILDTFDWLSPLYEFPQTMETVAKWCGKLPLKNVDIKYGYGGIELHAVRT